MAFKDNLAADMSVFFNTDEFAETCSYNGNNVLAIINRVQQPQINGTTSADYAQVLVKKSQVSSPKIHDILVFDEKAWVVENVTRSDGLIFDLTCHAQEGARLRD